MEVCTTKLQKLPIDMNTFGGMYLHASKVNCLMTEIFASVGTVSLSLGWTESQSPSRGAVVLAPPGGGLCSSADTSEMDQQYLDSFLRSPLTLHSCCSVRFC